jgi:hypothetical protein
LAIGQTQRGRHARRRAERAEHGGGMEAGLVHALGRHQAQAAHDFAADGDAAHEIGAVEPCCSAVASSAGMITAPACTGPPSNVSS